MVWHAPFTFLAGEPPTAAQLNMYLYDNMLETLAGKLNSNELDLPEGAFFSTGSATNSVVGYNIAYKATGVNTGGNRFSTSYGAPSPSWHSYVNPSITVKTGTRALVWGQFSDMNLDCPPPNQDREGIYASVAVSGATTVAASDTYSAKSQGIFPQVNDGFNENNIGRPGSFFRWFTNLNPGNNTFTIQMRNTTTTEGVVYDSTLLVLPFG